VQTPKYLVDVCMGKVAGSRLRDGLIQLRVKHYRDLLSVVK